MGKLKTHQGVKKRFKVKKKKKSDEENITIERRKKGRGSNHLKTKKSNPYKRRRKEPATLKLNKNAKKAVEPLAN